MSIKKLDDGRYEVDVRPQGSGGKRIRRKFDTKGEAQIFERYTIANYHNKEWLAKPADRRKLTDLLELWWAYHGKNHKYGTNEKVRLTTIIAKFGKMGVLRADQLTKKAIINYRVALLNEGLKPSTVNRRCALLSGMFTKLIAAGEYHSIQPFKDIKRLKAPLSDMAFLSKSEIENLLSLLSGDDRKAVLVCLATGGRWGEVSALKGEHIINSMVTFMKTKNGKRRSVPIPADLVNLIKQKTSGPLYQPNYTTVRTILKAMKPDLPDGQALHVFRHTFATHFMMNGGNIITLQRILGHGRLQQTMTYAHFAPSFLNDAVELNPLKGVSIL
jgi:integrase